MADRSIILASQSPRRRGLLSDLGVEFDAVSVEVKETIPEDVSTGEAPEFLAEKKYKAARQRYEQPVIITADTIVSVDQYILGKPTNEKEATYMLEQLSGREHQVMTGVCMGSPDWETKFIDQTEVSFRPLQPEEIQYYIDYYQPYDKAGGYAIQEWLGKVGVTGITGSFYNVVGLPIHRVYEVLVEKEVI